MGHVRADRKTFFGGPSWLWSPESLRDLWVRQGLISHWTGGSLLQGGASCARTGWSRWGESDR